MNPSIRIKHTPKRHLDLNMNEPKENDQVGLFLKLQYQNSRYVPVSISDLIAVLSFPRFKIPHYVQVL